MQIRSYVLFGMTIYKESVSFVKSHDVLKSPHAPGAYRPEAFNDNGKGKAIEWGVHIGKIKKSLPFIQRFDCKVNKD